MKQGIQFVGVRRDGWHGACKTGLDSRYVPLIFAQSDMMNLKFVFMKFNPLYMIVSSEMSDSIRYATSAFPTAEAESGYRSVTEGKKYSTVPICIKDYCMRYDRVDAIDVSICSISITILYPIIMVSVSRGYDMFVIDICTQYTYPGGVSGIWNGRSVRTLSSSVWMVYLRLTPTLAPTALATRTREWHCQCQLSRRRDMATVNSDSD